MGQSAAETVREIDDIRSRLEADLEELQARLPASAVWAKRLAGTLIGGGAAGSVLLFLARRGRSRKRAAVPASPRPIVQVMPERRARAMALVPARGRRRAWLALAVAVPLVLQIAELRELRKLKEAVSGR